MMHKSSSGFNIFNKERNLSINMINSPNKITESSSFFDSDRRYNMSNKSVANYPTKNSYWINNSKSTRFKTNPSTSTPKNMTGVPNLSLRRFDEQRIMSELKESNVIPKTTDTMNHQEVSTIHHIEDWKFIKKLNSKNKLLRDNYKVSSTNVKTEPNQDRHTLSNSLSYMLKKSPNLNMEMIDHIQRKNPPDMPKTLQAFNEDNQCLFDNQCLYDKHQNTYRESESDVNKGILKHIIVKKMFKKTSIIGEDHKVKLRNSDFKTMTADVSQKFKAQNDIVSPVTRANEFLKTVNEIEVMYNNGIKKVTKPQAASMNSVLAPRFDFKEDQKEDSTIFKEYSMRYDLIEKMNEAFLVVRESEKKIVALERERQNCFFVSSNMRTFFKEKHTKEFQLPALNSPTTRRGVMNNLFDNKLQAMVFSEFANSPQRMKKRGSTIRNPNLTQLDPEYYKFWKNKAALKAQEITVQQSEIERCKDNIKSNRLKLRQVYLFFINNQDTALKYDLLQDDIIAHLLFLGHPLNENDIPLDMTSFEKKFILNNAQIKCNIIKTDTKVGLGSLICCNNDYENTQSLRVHQTKILDKPLDLMKKMNQDFLQTKTNIDESLKKLVSENTKAYQLTNATKFNPQMLRTKSEKVWKEITNEKKAELESKLDSDGVIIRKKPKLTKIPFFTNKVEQNNFVKLLGIELDKFIKEVLDFEDNLSVKYITKWKNNFRNRIKYYFGKTRMNYFLNKLNNKIDDADNKLKYF